MKKTKPWLWLPAQWSHSLSHYAIQFLSLFQSHEMPAWKPVHWRGLLFKNPLGLAGGVDKNAEHLHSWWKFGCGFVEVGTVTPEPQKPNPGKIMDRDIATKSLWNRMGFPSEGMDEVFYNLIHLTDKRTPIFINVGKNRHTSNEQATHDYLQVMIRLGPVADAFVINISSPNTKGLRELQSTENLKKFLDPLIKKSQELKRPCLVKLSPDMNPEDFKNAIHICTDLGADGFILTNTTLSREIASHYPSEGGVSGAPLKELSKAALKLAIETLGPQRQGKLIVSVGGVMSPEDVEERLALGADLVEVYSALILDGPWFFKDVAQYFKSQQEARLL